MKPFLIVKTGSTFPDFSAKIGDFEDWIITGMGERSSRIHVSDAVEDEKIPDASQFSGVIITGSPAMVSHREPWSERTASWIRRSVAQQIPILGICYGHQLIAHALGGRVTDHPDGREMGTVMVHLTEAGRNDPLLGVLPPQFSAHVSHRQSVIRLPEKARRLAYNAHEPHHAFAVGKNCWGVQFHPEFSVLIMERYIRKLADDLTAEGIDTEKLLSQVRECAGGDMLLQRFAALAVK